MDTRRIVYYLSATAFFLFLATVILSVQEGDAVSARGRRAPATSAVGIVLAPRCFSGVN